MEQDYHHQQLQPSALHQFLPAQQPAKSAAAPATAAALRLLQQPLLH
jgi:hypothetical protein